MLIRTDRALANLGYGSRREVHALVRDGRVHHAGKLVSDGATKVDPAQLTLDGEALEAPHGLLVALHKPRDFVCSHSDRDGPSIFRLVPERWLQRNPQPTMVGRLDKDSTGLVLLTDRTALVHELTSPKRHIGKRYEVTLDRAVDDPDEVRAMFSASAIVLDGSPCLPAEVPSIEGARAVVILQEGRHRQVRRMFSAVGYEVVALHRSHMGPYSLGSLAPGEWQVIAEVSPR